MTTHSRPIIAAGLTLATLLLGACVGGGGSSSGGSGDNCSGSLAWCAPVGAKVQGATLYDGWEDLRIVPKPVNVKGGWTDSVAITADGLHMWFGYTRYDVSDFFIAVNGGGGSPFNPTGPYRPGMTQDTFQIFSADLAESGWTVNYWPENVAAKTYASASVNKTRDLMVFSDFVDPSATSQLNFSTFDGTNWSTPQLIDTGTSDLINAGCPGGGDDNGFVIGTLATSVQLSWESRRTSAAGGCAIDDSPKHHLYWTTFTPPSTWTPIEAIPGLNDITGGADESDDTQLSFSSDGSTAYWTKFVAGGSSPFYGLLTADWDGSTFANARPVITPTFSDAKGLLHIQGELNVAEADEGWIGYMMCGISNSDTPHDIDLYVCRMRKPAPATINTATGWSDSPFISRDGKRLYFMYSRYNFAPWILGGPPSSIVATGPDRPGLHKSTANPFDESDIYVSTKKADGTWGTPVNLGLNGAYGDSSGMEIDDGDTFIWLRGDGSTNNIVMATKNPDGTWGAPVDLGSGVNDPTATEDNPHLSADGNALWFVSNRAGGQGQKDIWYSTWNGSSWTTPVNQGANVNSAGDEDQPFISAATNDVYWNGPAGLMHCVSTGTDCNPPTIAAVDIPGCRLADGKFPAEASLPDDGKTIYFGCGDTTTGRVTIMYAKKQSNGTWGTATPVD